MAPHGNAQTRPFVEQKRHSIRGTVALRRAQNSRRKRTFCQKNQELPGVALRIAVRTQFIDSTRCTDFEQSDGSFEQSYMGKEEHL
jgi:hypothetical protein